MDYSSLILLSLNNTQAIAIFPLFFCQAYYLEFQKIIGVFWIKDYQLFCNSMWFLDQKLHLVICFIVHNLTLFV